MREAFLIIIMVAVIIAGLVLAIKVDNGGNNTKSDKKEKNK